MVLLCQECKTQIHKRTDWRCFTCRPMNLTKKPVLKQEIVKPEPELDFTLETMEKNHILLVLDACKGSKVKASTILGISTKTLYNKLTMYGLHIPHEGMMQ